MPLSEDTRATIVVKSSDGGATFDFVEAFRPIGFTDKGTMAVGPGTGSATSGLWAIYRDAIAGEVIVAGAALDAQGDPIVDFCGAGTGVFCIEHTIAQDGSGDTAFPGHVAIGPNGEIIATYFRFLGSSGPSDIFVVRSPDGLGDLPFASIPMSPLLTTNVGLQDEISAHQARKINPVPYLDWDRGGNHAYLVTTTQEAQLAPGSAQTDVILVRSDDAGATWGSPIQVNDPDPPGQVRTSSSRWSP